jgi:hypothetical protein
MNRTSRIIPVILIVMIAKSLGQSTGPSTEPAATQPSPQVQALINDLTSDSYEARQTATRKLVGMGEAVEPQLRAALQGDLSDEARARVTAALRGIQEHHDFGPSVITMHFKDAPLATVLNDFSAQAGTDLGVRRQELASFIANRRVSVDLDHANFWSGLETIGTISGLRPQFYNGDAQMMLGMDGGGMEIASDKSVVSGAFLVFAQQSVRSLTYGHGGNNPSLSLQLVAVAEPKLHIIGNLNPDWLKECVDEKGHSLLVGPQPTFFSNQSRWWWQLYTNLAQPPGIGSKIATLKGELKFNIQTGSQVVVVNNLMQAQNVTNVVGNDTLTVERCTALGPPSQYQLSLSMSGPALNGNNPWPGAMGILASIEVLDADDRPLRQQNMNSNMSTGKAEVQVYYFATNGPPARLRWEAATSSEKRTVPFELHDLELPNPP